MDKPIDAPGTNAPIARPAELSPAEMQHFAGGQDGTAHGEAW